MNSSNCAGDYEMMAPRSQLHSSPVVMQAWSRSRCQYNSGAVLKNLESVTERNALVWDCARNGRGRFVIRQVGNGKGGTPIKYVCTNPRCLQFEETVPSSCPKTNGQFMRQRVRHCTNCRRQGLVCEEIQIGGRKSTRFVCSNPTGCIALNVSF